MKHYTDSIFWKIVNILSEAVLAILVYLLSNFCRLHLVASVLKPYFMVDFWGYVPYGIMMMIFYIVMYGILGDYKTLHYRNFSFAFKRVVVVSFLGALLGSSVMFWFQDRQMSRGLLLIHTIFAIVLFSLKRFICNALANKYLMKQKGNYRVVVMGSNRNVIRYAKELIVGREKRYDYVGYIADESGLDIPPYLGNGKNLDDILKANECDFLVLSEDGLNTEKLDEVMEICNRNKVKVQLIPLFSSYFDINSSMIKTREGTKLVNLSEKQTTNILGVNIAVTNIDEVIERISDNLEKWRGQYICVSNVHTTVMSYENEDYCNVQNGAVIALPDGGPLSSYSRSHGMDIAERVTGPDLMRKILEMSGEKGWSHFFYGSSEETLGKLQTVIEEKYKGAKIAGMISPPYKELSATEEAEYVEKINATKPDFVWVGLGAPKQELWMARQKDKINGLMIGVGAAFDYESGNIKRAPKWMQKCSLEWLYRLMQDPKRLFKRYFVTNIKYMWLTRK